MVYYGLSLNAANLPGNIYINNFWNGLLETLAYFSCIWLLDMFGRRVMLSSSQAITKFFMFFSNKLKLPHKYDPRGRLLSWFDGIT